MFLEYTSNNNDEELKKAVPIDTCIKNVYEIIHYRAEFHEDCLTLAL